MAFARYHLELHASCDVDLRNKFGLRFDMVWRSRTMQACVMRPFSLPHVCVVSLVLTMCVAGTSASKDASDIHIMLIGKTGNGKSSTGNSILMKKGFFPVSDGSESMTKEVQVGQTELKGEVISVVDTPGLVDTHDAEEGVATQRVLSHFQSAMALSPHGVSAFVLVLNYAAPRFTRDELETVKTLERAYSPEIFSRFGIVLYTNKQNFKQAYGKRKFEDWCRSQNDPNLKRLLEAVKFRCIAFDNVNPSEEQRQELMSMIHKMNPNGDIYTDKNFKKAAAERKRLLAEENLPALNYAFEKNMRHVTSLVRRARSLSVDNFQNELVTLSKALGCVRCLRKNLESIEYPNDMMARHFTAIDNQVDEINTMIVQTERHVRDKGSSWFGRVAGTAAGVGLPYALTALGAVVPGGPVVMAGLGAIGALFGSGVDESATDNMWRQIRYAQNDAEGQGCRDADDFEKFKLD